MSTMRKVGLVLLLIVFLVTGCGSHPSARMVRGVIEVRRGVSRSSLRHSVMGITAGKPSAVEVRRKLGSPVEKIPSYPAQSCWAYHAHQPGTSIGFLSFCMNKRGTVARILIAE